MVVLKEIYDRETLLKACYAFTDVAYMHLDADERCYYVEMTPKDGSASADLLYRKLENELIFQQTRRSVAKNTQAIREIIIARAMASTIVDLDPAPVPGEASFSADDILKDWFEEHG